MPDPREVLAEIQAVADAATPGPWLVSNVNEGMREFGAFWEVANDAYYNPSADEDVPWLAVHLDTGIEQDARFIAAARTDVPRLVAALTAVLDMHHNTEFDWLGRHFSICDECSEAGGVEPGLFADYPCPTVLTITGALES